MNRREVQEIRRRFSPEKDSISHIYGCYVNASGEIVARIDMPLGLMEQEEGTSLRLLGWVSWHCNILLFLWIGFSLLLRVIQCHYYCIHIFYCQATIRNLKPMFCYIYFAHCAFTFTSKHCGETLSNHISFLVKEDLH